MQIPSSLKRRLEFQLSHSQITDVTIRTALNFTIVLRCKNEKDIPIVNFDHFENAIEALLHVCDYINNLNQGQQ